MSFHENKLKRRKLGKSNISGFDSMSTNCVGFIFLLSIKIALFRIKSCRRVRFC